MDRLRLCIVAHIYPSHEQDYKGIFVHDIASAQARRGHEVHVVTPRRPGAPRREVRDGVVIHRYWYWGWERGTQLGEFKRYPLFLLATQLLVGVLACAWTVLRHRLGLIHAYWVVPGGLIAVVSGKLTRRPVIVTAAGSDLNVMARKRIAGWFVRVTLRGLSRLIAAGSDMKRIAIELGMDERLGVVIPWLVKHDESRADGDQNGGNGETDNVREPVSGETVSWPGEAGVRVVYVGNLTQPKRVDTILRAMAGAVRAQPEAHLVIVGDGGLRAQLESLRTELGLDKNVHFWGARPHETIMGILRSADLFVHCSDNEGLPVAISEAISVGLPVVASKVGGIPDLVREGENGYLVGPDEYGLFAERLTRLLSDEGLRRQMSANARRFARENLESSSVIGRIEAVYREVLRQMNPQMTQMGTDKSDRDCG